MSARVMSARGLRAFLLVMACLTISIGQARASDVIGTVNLNFDTVLGFNSAGKFAWTKASGGSGPGLGLFPSGSQAIKTFCIDDQTIGGNPENFRIHSNLAGLPFGPTPDLTVAGIQQIGSIIETFMSPTGPSGDKAVAIFGPMSSNSATTNAMNAAIQAVVWSISRGIALTSTNTGSVDGNAYRDYMGTWLTTASNWNTYNENSSSNFFKILGLEEINGGQDHIYIVDRPSFIQAVPVPTGVVMAGMGIVCLGGVNFLRRRKVVAAV